MTTTTTKKNSAAPEPRRSRPVIGLPASAASLGAAIGAVATFASTFLAWTWTAEFPGDLTVTGYPGGLQLLTLTGALLTLVFVVAGYGVRGLGWLTPAARTAPSSSSPSARSPPPGTRSSRSP